MQRLRLALLPLACLLATGPAPTAEPTAPDARGNGLPALAPSLGSVKLKHDNMIIAAAFAPDGKTAATGGWDNLVRRWDVATGKELGRLAGHTKPVYGVAFTPDGKRLASASEDRTIRLWDVATGKAASVLEGHEGGVTRVCFTPDGRRLASSSYDQTVRVWEVATGKEIHKLGGQQRGFTAVVISPDGKYIATGAADFSVRLLELATGKEAKLFRGHTSSIIGIAFSPDGRLLATGGEDSSVRLWNVATGRQTRQLPGAGGVWAVAFTPDGRYLATGGRDKRLRVYDVLTGNPVRGADGHTDGVPVLDFSPDGRLLLSGSHDTTAVLWDWAQGRPAERLATNLGGDDLLGCWNALAGPDAVAAQRAVWRLAAAAPQAVPFLHRRMRPAEGVDAERLAQLVADLDSNVFRARQKATGELQDIGEQAELALRAALENHPGPEMKQRVERLLARIEGSVLKPEQLQALRALEVLERAGTPEARQVVEELAKGAPGARPTEEAKAVLLRMKAGRP